MARRLLVAAALALAASVAVAFQQAPLQPGASGAGAFQ